MPASVIKAATRALVELPLFPAFLLLALLLTNCAREYTSPMEGAWKLTYEYEVKEGQTTLLFPGASRGSEIKMWSGDRWALVGVFVEDSVLTDNFAGGKFPQVDKISAVAVMREFGIDFARNDDQDL